VVTGQINIEHFVNEYDSSSFCIYRTLINVVETETHFSTSLLSRFASVCQPCSGASEEELKEKDPCRQHKQSLFNTNFVGPTKHIQPTVHILFHFVLSGLITSAKHNVLNGC
jgi:hypothetical protein